MKYEFAWSRSRGDDIWRGGPCKSIEECVEEAKGSGYNDTDTFAVGYVEPYKVSYVNSDQIVEFLQQDAFDAVGEVAEDWLSSVTREQLDDLESRVMNVVLEWLKECKEEPTFYKVIPFDELTLKEALQKYKGTIVKGGVE